LRSQEENFAEPGHLCMGRMTRVVSGWTVCICTMTQRMFITRENEEGRATSSGGGLADVKTIRALITSSRYRRQSELRHRVP
jgi:hypothetical protein